MAQWATSFKNKKIQKRSSLGVIRTLHMCLSAFFGSPISRHLPNLLGEEQMAFWRELEAHAIIINSIDLWLVPMSQKSVLAACLVQREVILLACLLAEKPTYRVFEHSLS